MSQYWKVAAGLAAIYLLVLATAYLGQRRLLYVPHGGRVTPASVGLAGVVEREIATPDGQRLVAWQVAARPGQPTILYFHGNAGSLALRAERMAKYQARGRGMLMASYRGFSGSTGSPTEAAIVADALLAYDTLRAEGVAGKDIVLYGESLGTGVAVQVAAVRAVRAVVLEAPYTSTVDVGAERFPLLPVHSLMLDRFETLRHIGKVRAPILVVHGARDTVIGVEHGRRVHAAAPGVKELRIFPLAGHSNHHLYGSFEAINAWLDALPAAGTGR